MHKVGKFLLVVLVSIYVIGVAAAVTISITAKDNGKYVTMEHYYGAGDNANYNADGKGKVEYNNGVHVDESSKFSGKINGEMSREGILGGQSDNVLKSNHIVESNDYAIAKVHVMVGESGGIDEALNFNVNDDGGVVTKKLADNVVVEMGSGAHQKANATTPLNKGSSEQSTQTHNPPSASGKTTRRSSTGSSNAPGGNSGTTSMPATPQFSVGTYYNVAGTNKENVLPGDHDYVAVVKGNVKVNKHAKYLMPDDMTSGNALDGQKEFSYGVSTYIGTTTGNVAADTDKEHYGTLYGVNPLENGGVYSIWNGTGYESYIYNTTTNQWEGPYYYQTPYSLSP